MENRVTFLLAKTSVGYAKQENVKYRAMLSFVPDFRRQYLRINAVPAAGGQGAGPRPQRTYERLKRLMAMLKKNGTLAVFVAIPTQQEQTFDEDAVRIITDGGMVFLDLRDTAGLTDEHFEDWAHLNEAGASIYGRRLGRALAESLNGRLASIASGSIPPPEGQ